MSKNHNNFKVNCGNVGCDFETGRGFAPIGVGLPRNFLSLEKTTVCLSIAALYSNPCDGDLDGNSVAGKRTTSEYSRAMAYLAMYAGNSYVTLTTRQFRKLERRVRKYASFMRSDDKYAQNLAFANYVLRHAVKRAKAEKVIGQ